MFHDVIITFTVDSMSLSKIEVPLSQIQGCIQLKGPLVVAREDLVTLVARVKLCIQASVVRESMQNNWSVDPPATIGLNMDSASTMGATGNMIFEDLVRTPTSNGPSVEVLLKPKFIFSCIGHRELSVWSDAIPGLLLSKAMGIDVASGLLDEGLLRW